MVILTVFIKREKERGEKLPFLLFLGIDDRYCFFQGDFFALKIFRQGVIVFTTLQIWAVAAVVKSDVGFEFGMLSEDNTGRALGDAG